MPLTPEAVADVDADETIGGTSITIDNDDAGLFMRCAGAVNADTVAAKRTKATAMSVTFLVMFFVRYFRQIKFTCYVASSTFLVQLVASTMQWD